jgi:lincosamide nucleotidyltransferase A/C/D/E
MRADQVAELYRDMEENGVELWLLGGWGVDALLGRQTREHHDLDVLVELAQLERFRRRLDDLGFEFRYLWDGENQWVDDQPTAFVYGHPDGREIDTHVVRREADASFAMLWTAPHEIAGGLDGVGVVDGHAVRCLTAEAQLRAHTGYELPPHHAADVELLARLTP